MCAGKFPLVLMGGRVEGLVCADPEERNYGCICMESHKTLDFVENQKPFKAQNEAMKSLWTDHVNADE